MEYHTGYPEIRRETVFYILKYCALKDMHFTDVPIWTEYPETHSDPLDFRNVVGDLLKRGHKCMIFKRTIIDEALISKFIKQDE